MGGGPGAPSPSPACSVPCGRGQPPRCIWEPCLLSPAGEAGGKAGGARLRHQKGLRREGMGVFVLDARGFLAMGVGARRPSRGRGEGPPAGAQLRLKISERRSGSRVNPLEPPEPPGRPPRLAAPPGPGRGPARDRALPPRPGAGLCFSSAAQGRPPGSTLARGHFPPSTRGYETARKAGAAPPPASSLTCRGRGPARIQGRREGRRPAGRGGGPPSGEGAGQGPTPEGQEPRWGGGRGGSPGR